MRRRTLRPYGATLGPTRVLSLLMAAGVLWLVYDRFADPATWRWLTGEKPAETIEDTVLPAAQAPAMAVDGNMEEVKIVEERVDPGPNDLNEAEREAAAPAFEVVQDRVPLRGREMPAYWRLVQWSRTQSYSELRKRSLSDVATTQLWQQPEKYRAKPVRMRLHVRRVLEFDAPSNPLDLKTVVECWGWTEESKSIPFVVILADAPPDLPRGTDVRAELDFAGYFLKNMAYQATEKARSAPLFVGRGRYVAPRPRPGAAPIATGVYVAIAAVGALLVLGAVFFTMRRKPRLQVLEGRLPDVVPQDLGRGQPVAAAGGDAFQANWDFSDFDSGRGGSETGPLAP